jgi:hypothetical protein
VGGADVPIKLFSSPLGLNVDLDGKHIGKTPMKIDVTPGPHTVTFHDGANAIDASIQVREGDKSLWTYKQASGSVN